MELCVVGAVPNTVTMFHAPEGAHFDTQAALARLADEPSFTIDGDASPRRATTARLHGAGRQGRAGRRQHLDLPGSRDVHDVLSAVWGAGDTGGLP